MGLGALCCLALLLELGEKALSECRHAPCVLMRATTRSVIAVALECVKGHALPSPGAPATLTGLGTLPAICTGHVKVASAFSQLPCLQPTCAGLPYAVRKSESSGLAEGALAVPSVLAALACAVPQGEYIVKYKQPQHNTSKHLVHCMLALIAHAQQPHARCMLHANSGCFVHLPCAAMLPLLKIW